MGRPRPLSRPWSRTGENPPYGILGGTMETSASFEARSAPSSYPTCRESSNHGILWSLRRDRPPQRLDLGPPVPSRTETVRRRLRDRSTLRASTYPGKKLSKTAEPPLPAAARGVRTHVRLSRDPDVRSWFASEHPCVHDDRFLDRVGPLAVQDA